MVKRLPSARELWKGIPLPAIAQETVAQYRVHLFIHRISKGTDIFKNDVYIVETRDVFGMATEFTQANTEAFDNKEDALAFLKQARANAKLEYRRLSKNYEARKDDYIG